MSDNSEEEQEIKPLAAIAGEEEVEFETETSKRNVFFWAMYDLANTIYSMVIVSLIINRYILVIGQLEYGLSYGETSLIYGLVSSIMQIGVAIIIPVVGAFSDAAGKRKPFVISLTGLILLFSSLLGFTHNLTLVFTFYIIANVSYQFSLAFYDAMLPFIAKKEDIGKVSGFGVAWGYLGTIIALFALYPLILIWDDMTSDPTQGSIAYGYTDYWISFVMPMLLFLVFTIPFLFVKEKQKKGRLPPIGRLIKGSFKQVKGTFKDIRKHKPMFIFIIGYFFFADIANVLVLYMNPLVTDGLIIGTGGVGSGTFALIFIVISTVSAVLLTYPIGKFGNKYGGKNTFYLTGILWSISLLLGIILIFALPFIDIGLNAPFILSLVMGIVAGPALGGTWVSQRIMVTELAPPEKFGEYFGFSKLSGKISSSVGPLVFGLILTTQDIIGPDAYGFALIGVSIIMAIGLLIISRVKKTD
jgi:UMF1 family MFS transporter